jgi:hypothetical protein
MFTGVVHRCEPNSSPYAANMTLVKSAPEPRFMARLADGKKTQLSGVGG